MHAKLLLVAALAACGWSVPRPPSSGGNRAGIPRCDPRAAGLPRTALRAPVYAPGPTIAADDLRADFAGWMSQLAELHPDLSLRTDMRAFERTRTEIDAAITGAMTQREAWMLFARPTPRCGMATAGSRCPTGPR